MVRDRDGRLQEDPLAVYCFCVCGGSALLGNLLGVSRSRERDLLSVMSIYPRFFFCVSIVYCRILFCYMLMSVDCFGLVAPCGLRGCKNGPAAFPGRMSYKVTKPGTCLSIISKRGVLFYCGLLWPLFMYC